MSKKTLNIYLREIAKFKPLSAEEEKKLVLGMNRGSSTSRDQLILRHLHSVVKIAKLYQGRRVMLSDLIDEGNFGLLRALKAYDLSKGVRFISYGSWWIKHHIHKIIYEQGKIVRVPIQKMAGKKAIRKMESVLSQEFGRIPSTEEIAEALGITPHEVNKAMELAQSDFSLDVRLGEAEASLLDFVRASPEILENVVVKKLLVGELKEYIKELTDKEKLVITLRLGLEGEPCHKLREIGEILGLSRERVRQIEEKALAKIRRKLK
ncbi:RNA polymerase sigma factor RpoD/SigA [candidate division WOR-3 bacterium]|nr:RNA polymerase sigma factor RpoD/SigA [candidate division WOR-3 bacterium]